MDAAVVAVVIAESFLMWDALIRPIREHLPLWLLLLPMIGVAFVGVARLAGAESVRRAMGVHLLLSVGLCVWLIAVYQPMNPVGSTEQFQFRDSFAWVGELRTASLDRINRRGERRRFEVPAQWGPDIRFAVGVDGISVWFVALSVLLVAVGAGVRGQRSEVSQPVAWLWLQASLVGTFVALDVVLFVVCWMSTLFAVTWLLGNDGDSDRQDVTPRMLKPVWLGGWLVTLGLGGLVLALGWLRPSPNQAEVPLIFSIPELVAGISHQSVAGGNAYLWGSVNTWLFWLLVFGFTIPLGLVPFHRGFVEVFVSAPRGLAIVMAGVLLKVGVYGWLRFVVPVFPDLLREHADSFTTLAGMSSLLAAALAFGERDWRRRIALATCSSVGLSLIGVMTLTIEGLTGGVLRVLSHGLTAGLLVWLLPRTRSIPTRSASEALETAVPRLRVGLFRFALFAWIGLPGLSGFVAEFVTPFGLFQHEFNAAALSLMTSGLIAWMWVRAEREPPDWSEEVWSKSKSFIAGGLVLLNVALGVAPQFVVNRLQPSLESLLRMDRDATVSEAR